MKWLLLIPHVIALFFVGIGAVLVAIFGFFAVLFTGRWPLGAFEYMVGTFRWGYRVSAYFHLMTDAYPPFSLDDDPSYPVRLTVPYPEHVDRWRPLVQWLLAIPYLWIAGILYCADRAAHVHRVLHDPVHQGDPARALRAHGAGPAVELPRQRVRVLPDEALPAVRLGLTQPARTGR